jgi:hypothetical protein
MYTLEELRILDEIKQLERSIENRKRLIALPNKDDKFRQHHRQMIEHENKLIKMLKLKFTKHTEY